jgi:redox-sensitive bicupin YhaK (pirin superfamily)
MAIKIIEEKNQAKGAFAGGLILENKPIGFPQDGGTQKPYSNLFYWANAWSNKGGLIGEHPHKMFEIMSFVIEGEIQHYDSKFDRWLSLKEGDAQIIRAGNGITHAERIMENSRMFQIWFDPNIKKTIEQEATYNDYKADEMAYKENDGITKKNYIGDGGPVTMDAEGVEIDEVSIKEGNYTFDLKENKIYSYYLIKGKAVVDNKEVNENDFFVVDNTTGLSLEAKEEIKLFVIATPKELSYKTYDQLVKF